jgi:hypothetical protein
MNHYRTDDLGSHTIDLLDEQEMGLPDIPSTDPQLPLDVSNLDDRDLMTLFSEFTSWNDFASAQYGLAVITERNMERKVELAEARAWRDLPKSKSVSEAKALVVLNKEVQDAKAAHDRAYAYRKMVGEVVARYERDAAVISRELTRRTSDGGPKQRRRDRWTT